MSEELTQKEFAKMGNKALREKYPKEVRSAWGKKTYETLIKKYGPDHFKNLAKKSAEARKKRKNEAILGA